MSRHLSHPNEWLGEIEEEHENSKFDFFALALYDLVEKFTLIPNQKLKLRTSKK